MEVFLDASVFIWGIERPGSNSARVLEMVDSGMVKAYTSEKAVEEVRGYFALYHGEKAAYVNGKFASTACKVIPRESVQGELQSFAGAIASKDLEHLATCKFLKLPFLIAVDKHFEPFDEYFTPKRFLEHLGEKPALTNY